jgi:pimeloyl-ACP methyl ester carboxylesterase
LSDPDLLRLPDGRQVHLWQGGDPAGVPVLFQHGCPDTRLAAATGDAAARRAGVLLVAASRPGYGLSDPADSDHLTVADDTVAVADLLGIDRFALLGMSVGGGYALACAARHPGRVRSVAVVGAPAEVPSLDQPWPRDGLDAEQREFFRELARGSVVDNIARMRPGFEEYVARTRPDDPDDEALAARLLAQLDPRDAALVAAQPAADRARAGREALASPEGYLRDAAVAFRPWAFDVAHVRCPAYVLHGAADAQASVRNGEWLAGRLPHARLTVLEQTAHLGSLLEHWDEILTALRDAA